MGRLIRAALVILALSGAGVVVIGVGGAVYYRSVPKVEVVNSCSDPINIPEQFLVIPGIPESFPVGGSVTVPVVAGSGEYRLYEEGDGTYIETPRSLPVLGNPIRIGNPGLDPDANFDGAPVTIPMQRNLESARYVLTLCP